MKVLLLLFGVFLSALAAHDEYDVNHESFGHEFGPSLETFAQNFSPEHAHHTASKVGGHRAAPEGRDAPASEHMERRFDHKMHTSHSDNKKSDSTHHGTDPTEHKGHEINREKLFDRLRQLVRDHTAEQAKYSKTPVLYSQRKKANKKMFDAFNKIKREHLGILKPSTKDHSESKLQPIKHEHGQKQESTHGPEASKPHPQMHENQMPLEAEGEGHHLESNQEEPHLHPNQLPRPNTPPFCKPPYCPRFNRPFQSGFAPQRFQNGYQPFHRQNDIEEPHFRLHHENKEVHHQQERNGVPRYNPHNIHYSIKYKTPTDISMTGKHNAIHPRVFEPSRYLPHLKRFQPPNFPFARPRIPYPYFQHGGFDHTPVQPTFHTNPLFNGFRSRY